MLTGRKPLVQRQTMAKVMNLSVNRAQHVYCQTIARGIAPGRLKHANLNADARGQLTPGVVRVLQGR